MSYAMKVSRASARGDPGLLGFIGKAVGTIGGLLPGPAGAIAQGVGGVITKAGTPGNTGVKVLQTAILTKQAPALPGVGVPTGQQISGVNIGGTSGVTVGTIKQLAPPQFNGVTSGSSSTAAGVAICALKGTHMNRTGYYTQQGYVQAGTRCVKNRRRNPLNPRALSRAMSRIASAQKAVKCLHLFAGPVARASGKAASGRKRGGSCKRCR
jgi:hypothetical protein